MAWQINGVTLDYGPSFQDDFTYVDDKPIELTFPSKSIDNDYIYLRNYDESKTMSWDRVTSSLKTKLVNLPLFTNISLYDNISTNNYTIQILDRKIIPYKTFENSEVLWSATLKIKVIS